MSKFLAFALAIPAFGQTTSAPEALKRNFDSVNRKVLEMAQDFPADKYDYKLKPEMRTFGSLVVHIASGNIYAAKAGKGESANWDALERDPKKYPTKAECVALLQKSI